MRYLIPFICFILTACNATESPSNTLSQKGENLRTLPEYENVKSIANAVRSAVIDSCIISNELVFDEFIRVTPKMYQMCQHGNYKTKTCDFVNLQLGDIKQWSLVEAFKSKDRLLSIFRYNLISKKFDFPIELRITLTDLNKLTEFRFFKWEDSYSEDLIIMDWN